MKGADKGNSILGEINGKQIPIFVGDGDILYPGKITLHTDPVEHPGMIFYEIDDGRPPSTSPRWMKQLEKVPFLGTIMEYAPARMPVPAMAIP